MRILTFIRFDNAHAAVLTAEPLSGSIILARGGNAPCASRTFLNSTPSPATFPSAHAHCSATGKELFSRHKHIKCYTEHKPARKSLTLHIYKQINFVCVLYNMHTGTLYTYLVH